MQYVNCNICGTDKTRLISIRNGYRMVQCRNCGLVYLNPRPDPETLRLLYADYHGRNGKDEASWAGLMDRNFRKVSFLLNSVFPEGGKVLDIGCGYGHFMDMMKNRGWYVSGIDPSGKTVAAARKRGLDVIEGTIDDLDSDDYSLDAVTMFYVLEHLPDPSGTMNKVFRILKRGGVLFIRIPHSTPIVRFLSVFRIRNNFYDPPFHLYDFSPRTTAELLSRAGFVSINITPGEPTSPDVSIQKAVSLISGYMAKLLYSISAGTLLLPGVSKSIFAIKP